MTGKNDLQRFHKAQQGHSFGLPDFDQAFKEIHAGQKTSHWIWYILPQLKSLGFSANAQNYGLHDFQEACYYLHDPLLFKNYKNIVAEILRKLQNTSLLRLMGSTIDAQKLMSSLTLFYEAASYVHSLQQKSASDYKELQDTCANILAIAAKQHLFPCPRTLSLIQDDLPHKNEPK